MDDSLIDISNLLKVLSKNEFFSEHQKEEMIKSAEKYNRTKPSIRAIKNIIGNVFDNNELKKSLLQRKYYSHYNTAINNLYFSTPATTEYSVTVLLNEIKIKYYNTFDCDEKFYFKTFKSCLEKKDELAVVLIEKFIIDYFKNMSQIYNADIVDLVKNDINMEFNESVMFVKIMDVIKGYISRKYEGVI